MSGHPVAGWVDDIIRDAEEDGRETGEVLGRELVIGKQYEFRLAPRGRTGPEWMLPQIASNSPRPVAVPHTVAAFGFVHMKWRDTPMRVEIIGGAYWGRDGVSNFFDWREVMPDGSLSEEVYCGYPGRCGDFFELEDGR